MNNQSFGEIFPFFGITPRRQKNQIHIHATFIYFQAQCFSSWPTCRFSRLGCFVLSSVRRCSRRTELSTTGNASAPSRQECTAVLLSCWAMRASPFSALSHHVSRILRFWERTLIKNAPASLNCAETWILSVSLKLSIFSACQKISGLFWILPFKVHFESVYVVKIGPQNGLHCSWAA